MAERVRAFGLDLYANFEIAGLKPTANVPVERRVDLETVTLETINSWWPGGGDRLVDRCLPDGTVLNRVESHPDAGHRLEARGWGTYLVSRDADRIACAPEPETTWLWQRYLIGQVLPVVAVLRGLEPFHASAVARHGETSGFVGASEAGKSSIAVALLQRGWDLVADDVVAVEVSDEGIPLAHPSAALLSVRHPTVDMLGRDAVLTLGRLVGENDDGVRLAVTCDPRPSRLSAFYVLHRTGAPGDLMIEVVDPADPRTLLAASFTPGLRAVDRLVRQLDVCAVLARHARLYSVTIPDGCTPADVAAAIDGRAAPVLTAT
jgi:hypothetical protein